jgi:hypothetical protein
VASWFRALFQERGLEVERVAINPAPPKIGVEVAIGTMPPLRFVLPLRAILTLRYSRTVFVPPGDPLASKPPTVRRRSRHK